MGVLGPGAHKVLFETSECLWWVWGLILNAISPLLPPCWGLSFAVGHGVSFFGCIQHSPVDGCSAASCNFGVLTGVDERTSFYSTILHMFSLPSFPRSHYYMGYLSQVFQCNAVFCVDPISAPCMPTFRLSQLHQRSRHREVQRPLNKLRLLPLPQIL